MCCSCCVYNRFVLIPAGGSTCSTRYQVVTVKADGSLCHHWSACSMLGVWLLCEISSPSAPLMRSSHAWTHHAKWFRSFRNQLSTCSLFLWRNPPIARYTNYRQTDFCCNIYADIHSFVVDHGVLDVQPTQLWWSCWNEGALLLISVKLSLILRSSALFLVTPMHNYEEIWMFTQATACSNIVMFLCCVLWRDDCILVCLQYRQRHRLTSRSSPSAPR